LIKLIKLKEMITVDEIKIEIIDKRKQVFANFEAYSKVRITRRLFSRKFKCS